MVSSGILTKGFRSAIATHKDTIITLGFEPGAVVPTPTPPTLVTPRRPQIGGSAAKRRFLHRVAVMASLVCINRKNLPFPITGQQLHTFDYANLRIRNIHADLISAQTQKIHFSESRAAIVNVESNKPLITIKVGRRLSTNLTDDDPDE